MKAKRYAAAAVVMALWTALACAQAQPQKMTKEQCLSCHGPFDALVKRNVQVRADPGPVNPHVYVPHAQQEKFFDCLLCHSPHALPPPPGFHDKTASLEPCYGCHHGEVLQKCSSCHKNR